MFNNKYSKLLTVVLIISIAAIVILLVVMSVNLFQASSTSSQASDDGVEQFDGYINNLINNPPINEVQSNIIANNDIVPDINTENVVDPEINVENTVQNTTTNTTPGGNTGTTTSKPTYKGFNMVGKIEIPKINLQYPVLETVTTKSIEVSVAVLYGPGINEIGNTVIIGHNYRNGTFFSNNKKLSIGDKIYLTDLTGRKITYVITKKYNTGTEDFDYAVRDTNGKREISLSTCTDDSKQRLIIWAVEQ